jgi:tRNA (mo5U34)-methyltransferase
MFDNLETSIKAPRNERECEIASLGPWFHNLHLDDGLQTAPHHPLGDFPAFKWELLEPHLPQSLEGWTALDIGCNAGFYSFALARRGAEVTGIDAEARYLKQAEWAARQYGLEDRVRFEHREVYSLASDPRTFDLVLFLGVFYHLRYPLLGLDIVSEKVKRLLAFQTMLMAGSEQLSDSVNEPDIYERRRMCHPGWPKMAFLEGYVAGDPTNWWMPNHAGAVAMLRSAGFEIQIRAAEELYLCRPADRPDPCLRQITNSQYKAVTGRNLKFRV